MRPFFAALLFVAASPAAAQGGAQQPGLNQRVDRIEKELRAVQRKVFPGSSQAPGYLEPELSTPAPAADSGGVPSTAPIADLTARVSSMEQEMSRLTGQVEQNGYRLKQLEDQLAKFRGDAEYRINALEGNPAAAPAGGTPRTESGTQPAPPAPRPTTSADTTDALEPAAPESAAAPPFAEAAPVPAADPDEEAYLTGYRLWNTKKYPEAEAALKDFLGKYPQHKRASYAQNLLGRTYLDSNRPAAAAVAFHKNYTGNPRGERAPDSLYYLAQSLMRLDKPVPTKACEAYDALLRDYGTTISADLKAKVAKGQVDAKCKVDG